MSFTVAAFYAFFRLEDPAALQAALLPIAEANAVRGTLLLAPEGLNGTLAGPEDGLLATLEAIRTQAGLPELRWKRSAAETMPFGRLKIKVKREIVTFGVPEADPTQRVGTYVAPEAWNALIQDPDVLVIDTRNSFEFEAGSFARAVDPGTRSFGEFPAYVREKLDPKQHKKVAMFCTGGIRCEKATAFMLNEGFEEVYHLDGGILAYLEKVPPEQSLWHGGCFIFDERVLLGHGLQVLGPAPEGADAAEV
jgi:UPF0176 protein